MTDPAKMEWPYIDSSGKREARVLDVTDTMIYMEHRRRGATGAGQHTSIPTRLASQNMDTIMGWTRLAALAAVREEQ